MLINDSLIVKDAEGNGHEPSNIFGLRVKNEGISLKIPYSSND
jgi:hypothetical protein